MLQSRVALQPVRKCSLLGCIRRLLTGIDAHACARADDTVEGARRWCRRCADTLAEAAVAVLEAFQLGERFSVYARCYNAMLRVNHLLAGAHLHVPSVLVHCAAGVGYLSTQTAVLSAEV